MGADTYKKSELTIVLVQYYAIDPSQSVSGKLKAVPVGRPRSMREIERLYGKFTAEKLFKGPNGSHDCFFEMGSEVPTHLYFMGAESLVGGYLCGLSYVDDSLPVQIAVKASPATPLNDLQLGDKVAYLQARFNRPAFKDDGITVQQLKSIDGDNDCVCIKGVDYYAVFDVDILLNFFSLPATLENDALTYLDWINFVIDESIYCYDRRIECNPKLVTWADLIYTQLKRLRITSEFNPDYYYAVEDTGYCQIELMDGDNYWIYDAAKFYKFLCSRDFVSIQIGSDFYIHNLFRGYLDALKQVDENSGDDESDETACFIKDSQIKAEELARDEQYQYALYKAIDALAEYLVIHVVTPDSVIKHQMNVNGITILNTLLSFKELK